MVHMAERSPRGAVPRTTNGCGHLALQKAFASNSKQTNAVHCHYVAAHKSPVNYNPYTAPTPVKHTVLSTQGTVQKNQCSVVDHNSYTATCCAAYLSLLQRKSIYLLRKSANPHKGTMWPSRHRIVRVKLKQNSQTQKQQNTKLKNNTCATQTQPTKQQRAGLSTSVDSEKENTVADQLQALTELSATLNNVQKIKSSGLQIKLLLHTQQLAKNFVAGPALRLACDTKNKTKDKKIASPIVRHATAPQGTAGATCFSAGFRPAKATVNEDQTTPLTTKKNHHTRKDAKNGQRVKMKASTYVSAIPSHELCTSQRFPAHRHKLENSDDKSESHGKTSEDSKTHRRSRKRRRDNNKRKA